MRTIVIGFEAITMKTALTLLLLGLLIGCGSVMMVHPKTGERVTCSASARHPFLDSMETSACANQYEGLGFVRASDLTPEQRATLISNPRPIEIQREIITIREAKPK
jgi:hypothetical protein